MKTYKFPILCLILFVSACTAAGSIRPSKFTNPSSYLREFPLAEITEDELLQQAGPPDREITMGGKRALVYRVQDSGNRTFTYIFSGATVGNVIYNENGILNGATARTEQGK
jgi:hypothetical protein